MASFNLSWKDLSINTMTNLFLYGQMDTPSDLQDESLIRQPEIPKEPQTTTIVLTDIASFMTEAPGRYANGVQSELVTFITDGSGRFANATY